MLSSPFSRQPWQEPAPSIEEDLRRRLLWLMFLRVLFTTLLLGATIPIQWRDHTSLSEPSLLFLYGVIAGTYILTFVYSFLFKRINPALFAKIQLSIDALQVSLIIYITGGYASVFSFLYLVMLTYSSLFLERRGILTMAAFCSIQYGIMIDLEYYGFISPFGMELGMDSGSLEWGHVLFKITMTATACFIVAMLANLLSEQERRTRKELRAVKEHVKRVSKMASIGEMSSRLAHEIKNPLASLMGSVRLLHEDLVLEDSQDRLLQIILREADRLNELVTNFLSAAKPADGLPEKIVLEPVISEIVELFEKDDSHGSRVHISTSFTPDLKIVIDPSHFKQVIWNLLLNAAESIQGNGSIRIRTDGTSDGHAFIRISDNGPGIDDRTMQRLFEPFFTTKTSGTGLGLFVVHRILETYGFRLDVESTEGMGATFSIVAPKA